MDPIKIYLGTQIEQILACHVLAYSIRRHTQHPVEVTPLFQAVAAANIHIPTPRKKQLRPRTPFTFQRFAIPQLCGYQGRAIYLDSDMLVFRDICEIWQRPFAGNDLLSVPEPPESSRSPQYSVMLLNCEQLTWDAARIVRDLEAGAYTYEEMVLAMAPAPQKATDLPLGWNDLERYDPQRTALLHYTDMPQQPWLSVQNPYGKIWCEYLLAAIAEGAISRAAVANSVELGWVRPSLLTQVDCNIADPKALPATVLTRDRRYFAPPHEWQRFLRTPRLQKQHIRQWFIPSYTRLKAKLKAKPNAKPNASPPTSPLAPPSLAGECAPHSVFHQSQGNRSQATQPQTPQPQTTTARSPGRSDPPIYVLSVNYHSAALLASMLETLQGHQGVVIVNNSPEDSAVHTFHGQPTGEGHITVLDAPGNGGFGAGCNMGLQWLYERSPQALVWLLNPDAQLLPHAAGMVRQCFRYRPDMAILGTPVLDDSGQLWFGSGQFNPWLGSVTSHKPATPDLLGWPLPTRWVSGCSMVLNLAQLPQCPQFDDRYFLYYEDCDLCERYFQQGEIIGLVPLPLVTHAVSSITGRDTTAKTRHGTLSKLRFLQRHGQPIALGLNLAYLFAQSILWQRQSSAAAQGRKQGIQTFLQR